MGRHALDGLGVHVDRLGVLSVVRVEPAEIEEGRYLGGLVRARVLQAGPVERRAPPVHLDGLLLEPDERQDEAHIEMRHCEGERERRAIREKPFLGRYRRDLLAMRGR